MYFFHPWSFKAFRHASKDGKGCTRRGSMRDTDVLPRLSAGLRQETCGISYKSERSAEYLWYRRSVFSLYALLTVKQEKSRAVRFVLRCRRHAVLLQKRPGQCAVSWRMQESTMRNGSLRNVPNRTIYCGILYGTDRQNGERNSSAL